MSQDAIYTPWLNEVALASLVTDAHVVLLVSAAYVPDVENHTVRGDIPTTAVIAEAQLLNRSIESARFKCDDVVWAGVAASSATIESIIIVNNVTGRLVTIMQSVTGISIAPNGNDIHLNWDAACGVFGL